MNYISLQFNFYSRVVVLCYNYLHDRLVCNYGESLVTITLRVRVFITHSIYYIFSMARLPLLNVGNEMTAENEAEDEPTQKG